MKFLFSAPGLSAVFFFIVAISGCGGDGKKGSENLVTVYARTASDADMLNPINLSSADGRYISNLIFAELLRVDPATYELVPYLAVEKPTPTPVTEGDFTGMLRMDFEIRPEATWDDGAPVTADDYVFTIKSILNPKTNCHPLKPYYEWMYDVVPDAANPKKFTVYAQARYFKLEEYAGGYIIPEKVYDPEQLMRKFKIADMNSDEKRKALMENADITRFAESFNNEKYQRQKGFVVGCGPYAFDGWETKQKITLVRKKDWWGDKIEGVRDMLAYPDKILFRIIKEPVAATTALKDGEVDEYHSIDPKMYEELLKNETAKEKLRLEHPSIFAYTYIAFNTRKPKLEDRRVRKALVHAINKGAILETINYNKGEPVETFVHPSQKHFHSGLKPYGYNLDSARAELDAAGWRDTDGDGYRDKVINGEKTKLALEFIYPAANTARQEAGILMKEDLKKVGIDLIINGKDWPVYLQDMDNKNFEITYGGFTMDPIMSDPKQLWHTTAAVTGGSNFCSFGDAKSDKLIDDLRVEMDEATRIAMYKELQEMVHREIPVMFLWIPSNRIGINKRFDVETTLIDPGYRYNEFKLVSGNQVAVGDAQ